MLFISAFASTKVDARQLKQSRPTENTQMLPPPEIAPATPQVVLSSMDKATKNELETILRKPAITSEDK